MPRSSSKLKAWDIYAKSLRDLGFGHPLWIPEPSPESGEIQLGDVGYLSQGKFCFLFNCMRGADDPVNRKGVPSGFKVFVPPDGPPEESAKIIRDYIMNRMVMGGNAHSVNVETNASFSADPIAHAEGSISFKVEQKTGAFLALKRPAHLTSLHCTEAIFQYLQAHHVQWRRFVARQRGLKLESQHILFVSGFVKTAVWAVGAFRHESSSATLKIDAAAMFGGGLPVSASAGAAISVTDCSEPMALHRFGPAERLPWEDDASHSDDQCIFLEYAHLKPRLPILPVFGFTRRRRQCPVSRPLDVPHHKVDDTEYCEEVSFRQSSHEAVNIGEVSSPNLSSSPISPCYAQRPSEDNGVRDLAGPIGGQDESDDYAVDEEALDYILEHCSETKFACASSQDLFTVRQARRAWNVATDTAEHEVLPGLSPVVVGSIAFLGRTHSAE